MKRKTHITYICCSIRLRSDFSQARISLLSRKDFSEILASAWINCEAPHNDPDLNKANLLSMFKSADPKALMEDDEYEQLQKLDDTLTVYRGATSYNADNIKALSWSLSKETAEWFAHRFNQDGTGGLSLWRRRTV